MISGSDFYNNSNYTIDINKESYVWFTGVNGCKVHFPEHDTSNKKLFMKNRNSIRFEYYYYLKHKKFFKNLIESGKIKKTIGDLQLAPLETKS